MRGNYSVCCEASNVSHLLLTTCSQSSKSNSSCSRKSKAHLVINKEITCPTLGSVMTHVDYNSRIDCHHEVSRVIVNMSCAWDLDVSSQRDDWVFWKARSRQRVDRPSWRQRSPGDLVLSELPRQHWGLDNTGVLTTLES